MLVLDTELMLPLLLFDDGWYNNWYGVMIEACDRTQGQSVVLWRSVLLLVMVVGAAARRSRRL